MKWNLLTALCVLAAANIAMADSWKDYRQKAATEKKIKKEEGTLLAKASFDIWKQLGTRRIQEEGTAKFLRSKTGEKAQALCWLAIPENNAVQLLFQIRTAALTDKIHSGQGGLAGLSLEGSNGRRMNFTLQLCYAQGGSWFFNSLPDSLRIDGKPAKFTKVEMARGAAVFGQGERGDQEWHETVIQQDKAGCLSILFDGLLIFQVKEPGFRLQKFILTLINPPAQIAHFDITEPVLEKID